MTNFHLPAKLGLTFMLLLLSFSMASPSSATVKPDRFIMESIGVNAPLTASAMGGNAQIPPRSLWAVSRWGRGVRPCEPGSNGYIGHSWEDRHNGAVFNRLGQTKVGDKIRVPGCTYTVTGVRKIKASVKIRDCYSFSGRTARMCVISCVGKIGPGVYTHRIIVRARVMAKHSSAGGAEVAISSGSF